MHQIHHVARIHHGNVAEAADVPVAAPSPRLVARRPFKRGPEGHALRPRQAPNQFGVTTSLTQRRGWPDWLPGSARHRGYRPVVTLIAVCLLKTKKPICDTQDELVNLSFGRPTGLLGERGTVSPAG